jgi:hypothetical protein
MLLSEEGYSMKINGELLAEFNQFCYGYFKKERERTTLDVVESLRTMNKGLFKKIEKATGKGRAIAYVGSSLLKRLKNEGWLTYERKFWTVKVGWGRCNYCFKTLEEVYLIDIDHKQYCDEECFEDHGAVHYYDSYVDDYLYLFCEYQSLIGRYQYYLRSPVKKCFHAHLELNVIKRDILEVLNDDCFSTVLWNGGADGPLAAEMYRVLMVLDEDAKKLESLIEKYKNLLPSTNQLFTIEMDQQLLSKRKRPEVLREFIKKYRKYRNADQTNKWTTFESSLRSDWYYLFIEDDEVQGKFKTLIESKCPQCEQVVVSKWSTRTIDGYYYCHECYGELDFHFKLGRM